MKALTFQGVRQVGYEAVADPQLQAAHEVIVQVEVAGLCGSDLHPYRGHEIGLDVGTVMGHEFVGRVVEVGAGVIQFGVGDRVVGPFTTSCGRCFYCRRGLTARCESGQLFGWIEEGRGLHGSQAEFVRVPLADATLVAVQEEIASELALLAGDVLATGLFCAEMGGVGPGSVVVVLGCGPVGLMTIVGAREAGAERIFAVDSIAERLALAERLGAESIDRGTLEPAVRVREETEDRGADVVLEAVGTPEATRNAVDLVRPGGTVAATGVHTEQHFAFSPAEAYDKNLTYCAGRCSARSFMERTLSLIASGKYPLENLITHRLPLAEGPRAYQVFDHKRDGCVKLLLLP